MPSSRWRLSAESVTAAAAVLTAVIALAVGVWQTAETRRHNRLSVRPLLELKTNIDIPHPDSSVMSYTLRNRGLGLADIESMEIRVQTPSGGEESYRTWTPARPPIEAYGVTLGSRTDLATGTLIEPGQEVTLVEFRSDGMLGVEGLARLVGAVHVDVMYRSLYDERYDVSSQASESR